jgi:single-strand DNA-binding protein
MNLNKVNLIGNITKEVELKSLPSGMKVASLGLATNRNFKDKDGNKKEEVEYHNLVAFGKTAETIAQYCIKGQNMYFEGRLQTRSWEADGIKKYRTEIIVENFQFGKKPETKVAETPVKNSEIDYPEDEINPDDIPF